VASPAGLLPVLTVAGSDPTGGAGVQGDLKTFFAHGVFGTAVVTAITAQNHLGVQGVWGVEPEAVEAQLRSVLDQVAPLAAKTGMLWAPATVAAVARAFAERPPPHLVVDPVLVASAGGSLAGSGLARALVVDLFPLATVVTPNLPEAEALLRRGAIDDASLEDAARALLDLGCRAAVLKGGHARGDAVDVLATAAGVTRFASPRLPVPDAHGGGCALAASIAARLARGEPLERAVGGAKAYVRRALAASVPLGRGRGPVRHDVPAD
jgi:hydroxymethylpyrimidine/phosphomethylpyrimidine kinase